jgi:Zn-finger nucleic acid-binding protein
MSKSETTRANRKRLTDEWDEMHDKAGQEVDDDFNIKGNNTTEGSIKKIHNKVYGDSFKKDSYMQRSADDVDKQEEEDYKKEKEKFSKLKLMLKGK